MGRVLAKPNQTKPNQTVPSPPYPPPYTRRRAALNRRLALLDVGASPRTPPLNSKTLAVATDHLLCAPPCVCTALCVHRLVCAPPGVWTAKPSLP